MDIQPSNQTQAISDDQELAKVLAGVNQEADSDNTNTEEEVMLPTPPEPMPTAPPLVDPITDPTADAPAEAPVPEPMLPPAPEPSMVPPLPTADTGDSSLDSIKQAALGELRPLVEKLNVSPEEKFDTYLLLLRSTDDRDLIAPAHEAAKGIADEAKRAQALLDIIKEIDFLNQPQAN